MIPEGCTQVFPVYRWHVAEVEALAGLVDRLYRSRRETGPADDRYFFLSVFRDRLTELLELFRAAWDEVLYLGKADRDLVEKIAGYIRDHPDVMPTEQTA